MAARLAVIALAILGLACGATALSWNACEQSSLVWGTKTPATTGAFPYSDLWLYCSGAVNVAGVAVDAHLHRGTADSGAAADAFCQLLGFDAAESHEVEVSEPGNPTQAISGEFCITRGVYLADGIYSENDDAVPGGDGEPCEKLKAVTCKRTQSALSAVADVFAKSDTDGAEATGDAVSNRRMLVR